MITLLMGQYSNVYFFLYYEPLDSLTVSGIYKLHNESFDKQLAEVTASETKLVRNRLSSMQTFYIPN